MSISNSLILENTQIVAGFGPVDMQSGANAGDWVSLKNYRKVAIVLFKGVGTAGDDPTLTLQQATAVAGTGAKDLTFTTIYKKQGTLSAIGQWTKVTQTAATSYTDATSAEAAAIWVVEVNAEDLDVANGFDCVQASVADVGSNAQLGALLYLLSDPSAAAAPASMPSAIVD